MYLRVTCLTSGCFTSVPGESEVAARSEWLQAAGQPLSVHSKTIHLMYVKSFCTQSDQCYQETCTELSKVVVLPNTLSWKVHSLQSHQGSDFCCTKNCCSDLATSFAAQASPYKQHSYVKACAVFTLLWLPVRACAYMVNARRHLHFASGSKTSAMLGTHAVTKLVCCICFTDLML